MPSIVSVLTGAAGEHYVAYELSLMGYSVGPTRGGSPAVDLLVTNKSGNRVVAIQVKTSEDAFRERKKKPEDSHWEWDVGKKGMQLLGNRLLYAFVDLKYDSNESPDVFIVPSKDVKKWFGTDPNDWSRFRYEISLKDKNKYYERWDVIEKLLK